MQSKTFVQTFLVQSKDFVQTFWVQSKTFIQTCWMRSKTFVQKFWMQIEGRLLFKYLGVSSLAATRSRVLPGWLGV